MARRASSQSNIPERSLPAVDERSPMPLYHQIYLVLRDKIIDGVFETNAFIPGEQELVHMFGVSRITAKRALNKLAAGGLVIRQRGRGTRVAARTPVLPVRAGVDGLIENLIEMGLKTQVKLLGFDYVPATPDVARALRIEPGACVQHAVRRRALDGKPFSYLTTYVPERIGRTYSKVDIAARPLLSLLERSGVRVGSAEQSVSATLADPQVAPALDVEIGSPLLRISRVVFDQSGTPVEYIVALYRPDRYQYRMKLDRIQERNRKTWSPAA